MRIWGHVMRSRWFGPAARRSFARIDKYVVAIFLLVAAAYSAIPSAIAHEDQDNAGAAATATKPWPRVTAQSLRYELVGILKGEQLTIYLDDLATNEPVVDATLTVAIGDAGPVTAEPTGDGTYAISSSRLVEGGPVNLALS